MSTSSKLCAVAALATAALVTPQAAGAATTSLALASDGASFASGPNLVASDANPGLDPASLVIPAPGAPAAHPLRATRRSPAPEPSTWAMMLLGFGGAGALLRRRGGGGSVYRLVEALPGGEEVTEEFAAPDDATAWKRATMVAEGHVQLFRGDVRIAPGLNA